ncbi:MAG: hypothetical protein BGO04_07745 [Microbacterium sp. 70-38]|nr:MAG: hypothetical protein BGO04_07745 [Microbacterium sp. 70-38]
MQVAQIRKGIVQPREVELPHRLALKTHPPADSVTHDLQITCCGGIPSLLERENRQGLFGDIEDDIDPGDERLGNSPVAEKTFGYFL